MNHHCYPIVFDAFEGLDTQLQCKECNAHRDGDQQPRHLGAVGKSKHKASQNEFAQHLKRLPVGSPGFVVRCEKGGGATQLRGDYALPKVGPLCLEQHGVQDRDTNGPASRNRVQESVSSCHRQNVCLVVRSQLPHQIAAMIIASRLIFSYSCEEQEMDRSSTK
eukprot:6654583-Prymnesium_polylepis.2